MRQMSAKIREKDAEIERLKDEVRAHQMAYLHSASHDPEAAYVHIHRPSISLSRQIFAALTEKCQILVHGMSGKVQFVSASSSRESRARFRTVCWSA